jgi:hypothetical protein
LLPKNISTGGKTMTKIQLLGAMAGIAAASGALDGSALAGPPVRVGIGINVGPPAPYYYRPYYGPYYRPYGYYYYPPPAVVVAPPPVVVAPPPVVVGAQPAPALAPQVPVDASQPAYSSPAQAQLPTLQTPPPPPPGNAAPVTFEQLIANLRSTDENVRRNSVMDLGRTKALQAVQPLSATLAGDQSPSVREAAARALGLIGSPQGLPTLQYAAQADGDRDVRHSAQFAIETIKSK